MGAKKQLGNLIVHFEVNKAKKLIVYSKQFVDDSTTSFLFSICLVDSKKLIMQWNIQFQTLQISWT